MIGITLEMTAHDDLLKIFLPVLAGGGCSCWIRPKPTLLDFVYHTNCQRCNRTGFQVRLPGTARHMYNKLKLQVDRQMVNKGFAVALNEPNACQMG
jgi:hypothetical protein